MPGARVMFRDTPTFISAPHSPASTTSSGFRTPSSETSTSSNMSTFSTTSTDSLSLTSTKSGEALLFMRRIGEIMRNQPDVAAEELNQWLLDKSSPKLWRPMAYSFLGYCHELLDRKELAQDDYSQGLRLFDQLQSQLGKEAAERLGPNAQFMQYRVKYVGGRKEFLIFKNLNSKW